MDRGQDPARPRAAPQLRQPAGEAGLDRRDGGAPGEVVELVRVAAEVVELRLAVVVADELPVAGADRRVLPLVGLDLGEDPPPGRPAPGAAEEGPGAAAVDAAAAAGALARGQAAGVVEDRRRRVLVRDDLSGDRGLGPVAVARGTRTA